MQMNCFAPSLKSLVLFGLLTGALLFFFAGISLQALGNGASRNTAMNEEATYTICETGLLGRRSNRCLTALGSDILIRPADKLPHQSWRFVRAGSRSARKYYLIADQNEEFQEARHLIAAVNGRHEAGVQHLGNITIIEIHPVPGSSRAAVITISENDHQCLRRSRANTVVSEHCDAKNVRSLVRQLWTITEN